MTSTTKLQAALLTALLAASPAGHAFSNLGAEGAPQAKEAPQIKIGEGRKPLTKPGKNGATRLFLLDWETDVPGAWKEQTPSSSMRLAQYQIPGANSGEEGELVVFFFGEGTGGPVEANISRWQTQFSGPDGKEVTPKVEKFAVGGMNVTTAEFHGSYARAIGVGPGGKAKANQALLAAIVETPKGKLTFQLHGPEATVDAQRDAFLGFIKGLKPAAK